MPNAAIFAAIAIAALLSAWAARRDLQLPVGLTLTAFACVCFAASTIFGAAFAPMAALIFACLLIIETDRRHHLIPDALTLAIVLLSFVTPFNDEIVTRAIGAASLGATFLVIRQACTAWRGAEALGWGDIKLAAAMGAVLGPVHAFAAVAIAGAATVLVVVARMRANNAIAVGAPFGIGLAAATAAVALARTLTP